MNFIALPLLADPRTGGWPTYTAHLAHGLSAAGYDPVIFKLGKRSETKPRNFGRGLQYWNISFDGLVKMARNVPTLITAVGKNYREAARDLIAEGANVVIHDPTELDAVMREAIAGANVVTIRKIISDKLAGEGIANTFVPHPYMRASHVTADERHHAVSLSRIDFDKNTQVIVEANKLLPAESKVKIFGSQNTLYAKLKLEPADPDWLQNYGGDWPATAPTTLPLFIAKSAKMVVDLSTIKGDGGGTQYSFLEVFDAGKPLIIHKNWLTGNSDYDEIAKAVAATVESAEDLAAVVQGRLAYDAVEAEKILSDHDATLVATQIMEIISG